MGRVIQLFANSPARRPTVANPHRVGPGVYWRVRVQRYEGRHFYFDPARGEARSYAWWSMLTRIGGEWVYNTASYSMQTSKDFTRLRQCLEREGLNPAEMTHVWAPNGLQDLRRAEEDHLGEIDRLQREMERPRTHKKKNAERAAQIEWHQSQVETIRRLRKRGTR